MIKKAISFLLNCVFVPVMLIAPILPAMFLMMIVGSCGFVIGTHLLLSGVMMVSAVAVLMSIALSYTLKDRTILVAYAIGTFLGYVWTEGLVQHVCPDVAMWFVGTQNSVDLFWQTHIVRP